MWCSRTSTGPVELKNYPKYTPTPSTFRGGTLKVLRKVKWVGGKNFVRPSHRGHYYTIKTSTCQTKTENKILCN